MQCDVSVSMSQENVPVESPKGHQERQLETESSRLPTLELIEPNCALMDEEYELMEEDQSESTVSDWESVSAPDEFLECPEDGNVSDTEHGFVEQLSDASLPIEVEEPIPPPDEEFMLESEHHLIKKKIESIEQLEQPVHQAAEVQENLKTDMDQEMISRHIEQDINSYLNCLVDEVEPKLCVTGTPDVSQVVSEPVHGVDSASEIVVKPDMSQPEQSFISSVDDESPTQKPLEHVEVEAGGIQDLSTENMEENESVVNCLHQSVVEEQPRRMIEQFVPSVEDAPTIFPEETVSVEPGNESDSEPVDVTFQEPEPVHVNSEEHLELQMMEPVIIVSKLHFIILKN